MKRLEERDMEVLSQHFFANLQRNNCEYGGIGLEDKRPFGNSFVEGDILQLIGQKMEGDDGDEECWSSDQIDYANRLYDQLIKYLQKKYLKDKKLIPEYMRDTPSAHWKYGTGGQR